MRFIALAGCSLLLSACGAGLGASAVQAPTTETAISRNVAPDRSKPLLYVVNNQASTVTAYRAGGRGNLAPAISISGSNTQLSTPINLALNAKGKTFVTNLGSNAVTEYAADANGNVAPVATITCGGLDSP
ncbi:MAG: hypothetical protein WBW87_17965, partial [Candidatus Cybelea sp.]